MKTCDTIHKYMKKTFIILIGSIVAGLGLTIAVHMGFGAATLAVFWQGISLKLHMSLGMASLFISLLMIVLVLVIDRRQIHIGTFIYQLAYSGTIAVLEQFIIKTPYIVCNFILMLVGLILLGFGTGLYAFVDMGRGPYEALTFAICKRTNWQIRVVRIVLDILFVFAGYLLGGTVGLGTIFAILLIGPTIQKTLEVMGKTKNIESL